MASAGYDIGLSVSDSKSATSSVSAPFSVTGGGGSALANYVAQTGDQPSADVSGTPANSKTWLVWLGVAASVVTLVWFFRGK